MEVERRGGDWMGCEVGIFCIFFGFLCVSWKWRESSAGERRGSKGKITAMS